MGRLLSGVRGMEDFMRSGCDHFGAESGSDSCVSQLLIISLQDELTDVSSSSSSSFFLLGRMEALTRSGDVAKE